ncbi:MAG: L,D-transpeptidase family protein [Acidimicrobiia bacterium]|nr:L,D-transpeptidase family protein [Acidimicrobiia bacterium]
MGLYDPLSATWYLRDTLGRSYAFEFGPMGALPVVGDWDGDGFDTVGAYDPATGAVVIYDDPDDSVLHAAGGTPVAGDADGDGRDEVTIVFWGEVTGWEGAGFAPTSMDAVLAVDLDDNGRDELVVHSTGVWWAGGIDAALPVMAPGDRATMGDWDGDGVETLGVFRTRNAEFWLYGGRTVPEGVTILPFGSSRMMPVSGRFEAPPGYRASPPRIIDIPPLSPGDSGWDVARLQVELSARDLYRGAIDGSYGLETEYAVMAFHKAMERERTWSWEPGDTDLLVEFKPTGYPIRLDEPDRIEVDIGRQVLFLIRDHQVVAIVPVSTGGGYIYYSKRSEAYVSANTPRGDFKLLRYYKGWSFDPLYGWSIYNPWNFTEFYAVHGYPKVPEYPASHGCIRIPNWEADALESSFFIGMPVHVWDVMPVIPQPVVIREAPPAS